MPFFFAIPPVPKAHTLFATYQYTAYTIFDTTSPDPSTPVSGVGGTLSLRPDSTYEKHFSLLLPSGPRYFNQTGRFSTRHDSIRFAFTDLKGPDVQRGTFRLDPTTRRLTITIFGFPTGNQGVYELMPQPPPNPARTQPKKRRPRH